MDGFGATERVRLQQAEQKIARLEMMLRNVSGQGVSTQHGVLHIRPVQVGFAAELTSSYNSTTGYSWKQLRLSGNEVGAESTPLTGDKAFAIDESEDLEVGDLVWLEPDPTSTGYLIVPAESAEEICIGPVVTAVTCNAGTLSVTTKYIHLTGHGLSVTVDDTPC